MFPFDKEESLTRSIIRFKVVFLPTLVALIFMLLSAIVEDKTSIPSSLYTGTDSPVKDDSSISPFPSQIIPSTGNDSPFLISKISPS